MMDEFDSPISEIVKKDYRTADVFKKYQLSFCCSGNVLLKSACEAKGIDYEVLTAELRNSTRNLTLPTGLLFNDWKLDFLIDFISNVYHANLYQVIPALSTALASFTLSHNDKYPELTATTELFTKLAGILVLHNRHEDEIIFPYIKQIDSAYRRNEPYGNLFVKTLRKPLHIVEKEHSKIKELLNDLKLRTNQFTAPDNACLNYSVLYKKLEDVHNNLIQHKYLEQEILLPRAIAIEQKLM